MIWLTIIFSLKLFIADFDGVFGLFLGIFSHGHLWRNRKHRFLFSKCQEDVQEQNNATQISFFCTLLTIKDIGSKLSQQCMNPHITQFLYIIYIIYNMYIASYLDKMFQHWSSIANPWKLVKTSWAALLVQNGAREPHCTYSLFLEDGKDIFPVSIGFCPRVLFCRGLNKT